MIRSRNMCGIGRGLMVGVLVFCAGCVSERITQMESNAKGKLIFEENFSDDTWQDRWTVEGYADTAVRREGETSYLEVTTKNQATAMSVIWCRQRFPGNCRYEFRAKAESHHNPIIYFHARPTETSGADTIFAWKREATSMEEYAGRPYIEMYSVGILRDHQPACNLRFLGGTGTSEAFQKYWKHGKFDRYDAESVFHSYPAPSFGKPDTWFDFALQVKGKRITLDIDGKRVMDLDDPGRSASGDYTWKPLTDGGRFAFQAFVMGAQRRHCLDSLRVYQLPSEKK